MLTYSFENLGNERLYIHLYKCIREDIVSGKIAPGTKLPSKRSFAKNLGVSVITVENAYQQLVSEGYLYAKAKKGYFASDLEKSTVRLRSFEQSAVLPRDPRYFADFTSSRTDPENFPFATWTRLMREIISEQSAELMTNAPCGGIESLRQAIAEHLYAFRGIEAQPGQIIVGAGTEYLYGLLIQLLGFDKKYALEDPGYRKIAQIYESHKVDYTFVPMDHDGVSPKALMDSGADILHISPSHHFPTGTVTPISRRYILLSWAAQSENRYIIEDDYDSEFRFVGKPIPALQSIDVTQRVIYMNTFSKSLSSTVRISYMVLPPALVEAYYRRLGFYACTVPNLEQYTLANFISRGYLEKHINRMRNRYKYKRDLLLSELERRGVLQDMHISDTDAGLHFLVTLKKAADPEKICLRAAESGIRLTPLSRYYHDPAPAQQTAFVISYSSIPDEKIPEAVRRLAQILRDET